jgi:hypothetical protein
VVVKCCCMCKKSEEYVDHLLIHCEVARELQSSILNVFGVDWVLSRRVIDLLLGWKGQAGCGTVI